MRYTDFQIEALCYEALLSALTMHTDREELKLSMVIQEVEGLKKLNIPAFFYILQEDELGLSVQNSDGVNQGVDINHCFEKFSLLDLNRQLVIIKGAFESLDHFHSALDVVKENIASSMAFS